MRGCDFLLDPFSLMIYYRLPRDDILCDFDHSCSNKETEIDGFKND